jgi:hypothetical protein
LAPVLTEVRIKALLSRIVDKLNKEVNAALDDPKTKARLADLGGTVLPGSPQARPRGRRTTNPASRRHRACL